MTEHLDPPDAARFPALTDQYLRVIPASTRVARIYSANPARVPPGSPGYIATGWADFRHFGPLKARFEHHPLVDPPQVYPNHGILYATPEYRMENGDPQNIVAVCVAEVYRNAGAVETRGTNDPYLVIFEVTRDLRLLDLTSMWLTHAGGNGSISSGPHGPSSEWARAVHATYPSLDGLFYTSSNMQPSRAIALWERCEDAMPLRPQLHRALADPAIRDTLEQAALEVGIVVV